VKKHKYLSLSAGSSWQKRQWTGAVQDAVARNRRAHWVQASPAREVLDCGSPLPLCCASEKLSAFRFSICVYPRSSAVINLLQKQRFDFL
jgi:hypothetical protein